MKEVTPALVTLCLQTVKGTRTARKTLKQLRPQTSEIKRIRKIFGAHNTIFLDELQLLFQEALDSNEAEALVNDIGNPGWISPDINDTIRTSLGDKYDECRKMIGEMGKAINGFSQSLDTDATVRSRMKGKARATDEAVQAATDNTNCRKFLDDFYHSIQKLVSLRRKSAEIQYLDKTSKKRTSPMPSLYQEITLHSKSFYMVLQAFWTCLQDQHTSHDIRLMIDHWKDGRLRVVVCYRSGRRTGRRTQSGLLDFLVSSRVFHVSIPSIPKQAKDQIENEERPQKMRRVRFSEDCAARGAATGLIHTPTEPDQHPEKNLCSEGDMCSQLCAQIGCDTSGVYLDAPDRLRHYVSPICSSSCDHTKCLNAKELGEPVPLQSIFRFPVENTLSVTEQLRLALKLVKGVLQYQSTPWLQPRWTLQDLSYFDAANDLANALETLHISSDLVFSSLHRTPLMDSTEQSGEVQGKPVPNVIMHHLGVALLQIGSWTPLDPSDYGQIQHAVDLSESYLHLGSSYHRIAKQCLECNFGFGTDLSVPELQNAIYRDVVCELERLIQKVDSFVEDPK
ncbi:hypothetical protein B0I35DRAFT_509024 [Stachybotrys elegans]|uniref:DUF7580 domain-containing protein n=1 Tax=Stachybotrys elegans TaxID=80388 RepID=A0A8K0WU13_9HYPO|nr:hypothetical protein B0I35DRAFT_509024 [Stachybotrys elegans]